MVWQMRLPRVKATQQDMGLPDSLTRFLNALGGSDFTWACLRLTRALAIAAVFVGTKYLLKLMIESQTTSEVFKQAFDTVADVTFLGLGLVITIAGVLDVAFVVLWDAWVAARKTVMGEKSENAHHGGSAR